MGRDVIWLRSKGGLERTDLGRGRVDEIYDPAELLRMKVRGKIWFSRWARVRPPYGIAGLTLLACLAALAAWVSYLPSLPSTVSRVAAGDDPVSVHSMWPNLFGPSHDSHFGPHTPEFAEGDFKPVVVWKKNVGRGYSAPVVWGSHLILLQRVGQEEVIECLETSNGHRRWAFRYPSEFVCAASYSDGPYSTPVIDGECVYAVGAQGQVHCVDFSNGQLRWRRSLEEDFDVPRGQFPSGASPRLESGRLILNAGGTRGDSGIIALDIATGKTAWSVTRDAASYATPVAATIHGQRHLIALTHEAIVSIEPFSGRVDWQVPFRPKNPDTIMATTPIVWRDIVFVSAYQVGAMAIRIGPGRSYEVLWRNRRSLDSQHNNLVCLDGIVIGFSARDHQLHAVDILTGRERWIWESEFGRGSILVAGKRLIVFGESGKFGMLQSEAKDCRSLYQSGLILSPPCYSAPAVAEGKMFLRNDSELCCVQFIAQ